MVKSYVNSYIKILAVLIKSVSFSSLLWCLMFTVTPQTDSTDTQTSSSVQ